MVTSSNLTADLIAGRLSPESLPDAGGGDYCQARDAGPNWLLLIARTDEASHSLERAAAVLPHLLPRVTLAIPEPGGSGLVPDGRRFLHLRRVPGVPLSAELLRSMTVRQQNDVARAIGEFLGQMHRTSVEIADAAGIPTGWYPFAATEDEMRAGPAGPHYATDLQGLAETGLLDASTLDALATLVDDHLRREETGAVLLHGEVSADHVLVDPDALEVTGIIDFQGLVLGDPARDFLYIADDYGPEFLANVLNHYPIAWREDPLEALAFYRVWHLVVRLIWQFGHGYAERADWLAQRLTDVVRETGR